MSEQVRSSIRTIFSDLGLRVGYALLYSVLIIFTLIPFRLRYYFGGFLGRLTYLFDSRHRRIALTNLELAFPQWDDFRRRQVARRTFVNFGRLMMEVIQFLRLNPKSVQRQVEIENLHFIENARARGKGVIFLTAHFGNWELSALSFSFLVESVDVVVRPLDSKIMDRLVEHLRTLGGNRIIKRRRAAGNIVRSLKENRMVGILMDQNQRRSAGIFANFFGIPACTTPAIAMIARKTGSAVIPAFLVRDGFKKYRLIFKEDVPVTVTDNKQADIIENTTRFNKVIEEMVRQYPDQYFWLHRRWKTRPDGEPKIYK
jgi:KDO2-lipid IV(A) lauroyltransferase